MHEFEAAGKYYEDALNFRPYDAELCVKVARIAHQVGEDLRKAKELASTACELEPDNSFYRLVLGKIFKAAGLKSNARREFEAALRLDPMDAEAKRELKSLR
jgi:tetratricopeptide (TPR) repeat protein